MRSKSVLAAAESSSAQSTPSQDGRRGDLQSPNTAEQQGRSLSAPIESIKKSVRVLTLRIDPTHDTWLLLLQRLREYANYANLHMQGRLADARGWKVPPSQADTVTAKKGVAAAVMRKQTGVLSSNCYCAAENEVKKDWTRQAKEILAGAPLPQYRERDSLGIATISGRPGVVLTENPDGSLMAAMQVSSKDCEGGTKVYAPVSKRSAQDARRWPKALDIARGVIPVLDAKVSFKRRRGLVLLRLAYPLDLRLHSIGSRVATIGVIGLEIEGQSEKLSRLLVRSEVGAPLDVTGELQQYLAWKQNFDAMRRRIAMQIGRRRGGSRAKRRKIASFGFEDRTNTHFQQLASKVLRWCAAQGVGELRVLDLGGGDWPAHKFKFYLGNRGENDGILVTEVKPESSVAVSTEKSVAREQHRRINRRKKLGDAVREIQYQKSLEVIE